MIHHISIGVHEPERVAQVLSQALDGPSVPFPDVPGAFIVFARDPHGTAVETHPYDMELRPGARGEGLQMRHGAPRNRFVPFHAAISVARTVEDLKAIAAAEGWQAEVQSRGAFHVLELWIENELMLELLPPEFATEYLSTLGALA